MEASDVKRLKDLELENNRLRRLPADNNLDKEILKDVIEVKGWGPTNGKGLVTMILLHFGISLRRTLDLIDLSSFMLSYRRKRDDLEALVRIYADEHPTNGQDRIAKVFHRSHGWNHKKSERLYPKLKLANVRKKRLRRLVQPKEPLLHPLAANECWSMGFMSDSLMDGSKVRVLNVIDDYNQQYMRFDVGRSLHAPRVT